MREFADGALDSDAAPAGITGVGEVTIVAVLFFFFVDCPGVVIA